MVSLTLEIAEAAEAYAAGHETAREFLARRLRSLGTLYREHLWNEDHVVLPLAEKILSPEELDVLSQAFQGIESRTSLEEVARRISLQAQRCDCLMGEVFI